MGITINFDNGGTNRIAQSSETFAKQQPQATTPVVQPQVKTLSDTANGAQMRADVQSIADWRKSQLAQANTSKSPQPLTNNNVAGEPPTKRNPQPLTYDYKKATGNDNNPNGAIYLKKEELISKLSNLDKAKATEGVRIGNIVLPTFRMDMSRGADMLRTRYSTGNGTLQDLNTSPNVGPADIGNVYGGGNITVKKGDKTLHSEVDTGFNVSRHYVPDPTGQGATKNGQNYIGTWTTDASGMSRDKQFLVVPDSKDKSKLVVLNPNGQPVDRNGKVVAQGSSNALTAPIAEALKDGVVSVGGIELRPNFSYRPYARVHGYSKDPKTKKETFDPNVEGLLSPTINATPGSANDRAFFPGERVEVLITTSDKTGELKFNIGGTELSFTLGGNIDITSVKTIASIDQDGGEPAKASVPTQAELSGGYMGSVSVMDANGKWTSVSKLPVRVSPELKDEFNKVFSPNNQQVVEYNDGTTPIFIDGSKFIP